MGKRKVIVLIYIRLAALGDDLVGESFERLLVLDSKPGTVKPDICVH